MTTVATLFGIALAPLYTAIAEVESNNGKTSINVYQIDEDGSGYIDDVNRILAGRSKVTGEAFRPFVRIAKYDRKSSEAMMAIYWDYYGRKYEQKTGKKVTAEVLARIHNGGPTGWRRAYTCGYWNRVKAAMERGQK